MGEYSDRSDIVRLRARDLREEHGEDEDNHVIPTVIGILVGVGLWIFLFFI